MQVYDQVGFQPTARTDTSPSGLMAGLKGSFGFAPSSQALRPEGVRRGGPVLEVKADESHLAAIAAVLNRCGAEDISTFTAAEQMGGPQG